LGARATGAVLGWVSMTAFAAIAWWFVFVAETRWLALPGLTATVVAPIALWALYLIVADMRSGAVVSETGQLVILREGDSESKFLVRPGRPEAQIAVHIGRSTSSLRQPDSVLHPLVAHAGEPHRGGGQAMRVGSGLPVRRECMARRIG